MTDTPLTAISANSIQVQVLDRIRQAILSGRFASGQPLRIEALSSELGVSHMPVREALHILTVEGLAVRQPRRGVVVSPLDHGSISQAFEVLAVLEGGAAASAARRATPQDLAALRTIAAQMAALRSKGSTALLEPNRRFHDRIAAISPNPWHERFARQVQNAVYRVRHVQPRTAERLDEVDREHTALIDAIAAGDAVRAKAVAEEHCLHSLRDLLAQSGTSLTQPESP